MKSLNSMTFQVFHDLYKPWLTSISKSCYLDDFFLKFAEVLLSDGTVMSMSMHLPSFLFLHISPNTLACLPPKFCIRIVFWFLSRPLWYPKEIKDNRYAKFWEQTRWIIGYVQMVNGQFWNWLLHKRELTVLKLLVCSWHHDSHVDKKNKSFSPHWVTANFVFMTTNLPHDYVTFYFVMLVVTPMKVTNQPMNLWSPFCGNNVL